MNIDNLVNLRKNLGLTQSDIASLIDVKRNTYSEYEHEMAVIPLDKLNIISNEFDVSLDYLLNLSNKNSKNFKHIDIDNIKIGERLLTLRKEYKYTQGVLAKKLGVQRPRVSDYEAGKRLTVKVLVKYSMVFNKSIDYLCGKFD